MAPPEPENNFKYVSLQNDSSFRAAIFHTMAFKLSLESNNDKITIPIKKFFLKVVYNICKRKKKLINFEQNGRLQLHVPKNATCETTSNMVFVLNSSFTTKDEFFRVAIAEACDAFNKMLLHFGCTKNLENYDPQMPQVNSPQTHPFR